jgi:26S proteasome regulatory subunit N2
LPEPSSYNLANPARVVRLQLPKLAMPRGAIYAPMRPINQGGIVIFEKINADAEEEIVEMAVAGGMTAGEADANKDKPVEPHAPFEFVFDDH